jgi:hypothetical protein
MGTFEKETKPGGLTNAGHPIVSNDGPGKPSGAGLESLSLSSLQAGGEGSIAGPIDPHSPDHLLGAVISSDYLPGLEHALDQLTTSINLFDVPCLDFDVPGYFDGGSQI